MRLMTMAVALALATAMPNGIRIGICSVRIRKRLFFWRLPEVEGLISGLVQAMARLSHLDLGSLDSRR